MLPYLHPEVWDRVFCHVPQAQCRCILQHFSGCTDEIGVALRHHAATAYFHSPVTIGTAPGALALAEFEQMCHGVRPRELHFSFLMQSFHNHLDLSHFCRLLQLLCVCKTVALAKCVKFSVNGGAVGHFAGAVAVVKAVMALMRHNFAGLTTVDIRGVAVGRGALAQWLGKLHLLASLEELVLQSVGLLDEALARTSWPQRLTHVDLLGNSLTLLPHAVVARMPATIRWLNIAHNEIENLGLARTEQYALCACWPALRVLDVSGNEKFAGVAQRFLAGAQLLTVLIVDTTWGNVLRQTMATF